jgi:hypothetical protein
MIIKNECTNPPWGLEAHVRRSIGWMSPVDLHGIAWVRLKDEIEEVEQSYLNRVNHLKTKRFLSPDFISARTQSDLLKSFSVRETFIAECPDSIGTRPLRH